MAKNRTNLIEAAFRKLDKSGDGFITPADLKGVYNVRYIAHLHIFILNSPI